MTEVAKSIVGYGVKGLLLQVGSNSTSLLKFAVNSGDLQSLQKEIKQNILTPSVAGVPIFTESLEQVFESDVAETMLVDQISNDRLYVGDNVATRPRKWSLHGYITQLNGIIEDCLPIKPSLLIQEQLLVNAWHSRQEVYFKSNTGAIYSVVIQRMNIRYLNNSNNAREVTLELQEVPKLSFTSSSTLSLVTKAEQKSVKQKFEDFVQALIVERATPIADAYGA